MILPRYYFSDEFTKFEPQLMELGQIIEFQEGEYLSAPDELMSMCYYIKKGIARFSILNDEGDENIIMFFGPGSINPCVCGEYEFTLERYIIVKAITKVTAIAFPPAVAIQMLNAYGKFGVTAIHHYWSDRKSCYGEQHAFQ